jgi:hypothetical protein
MKRHTRIMSMLLAAAALGPACEGVETAVAPGDTDQTGLRFVAEVLGETRSSFTFLQAPDASFVVIERGPLASASRSVPAAGGLLDLYRAVAPRSPVPARLLLADQNHQLARSKGLLGTSWLPAPTAQERSETEVAVQAIEVATTVGTEVGEVADGNEFLARFCNLGDPDRYFKCAINASGSLDHEAVPEEGTFTLDMVVAGQDANANLSVHYETCSFGLFCDKRLNGSAAPGHFLKVMWRDTVYDVDAHVSGSVFHYRAGRPL